MDYIKMLREDTLRNMREKFLYILAEFFKVLGNPVRIHLLLLLAKGDACAAYTPQTGRLIMDGDICVF